MNTQYYPRSTVSHQAMMRLLQLMGYMRQKGFRDDQVEQADCSALSLAGLSFNADSAHPILFSSKASLSLNHGISDDCHALCRARSPGGTAKEAIPAGRVSSQHSTRHLLPDLTTSTIAGRYRKL